MTRNEVFEEVYKVVRQIPEGSVMTYGQIGSEIHVNARTVGWAMASANGICLPWHRVVGSKGHLPIARRSPSLVLRQRQLLEDEGVEFLPSGCVDMASHNHAPIE